MLSVWGSMKKKPLCSVPAAHGNSSENNQANWISSVAALTNTDLVASGKKPKISNFLWRSLHAKHLTKQGRKMGLSAYGSVVKIFVR